VILAKLCLNGISCSFLRGLQRLSESFPRRQELICSLLCSCCCCLMLRMLVRNALPFSSNVLRSTAIFSILVLFALMDSGQKLRPDLTATKSTLQNRMPNAECLSRKIFGQARYWLGRPIIHWARQMFCTTYFLISNFSVRIPNCNRGVG